MNARVLVLCVIASLVACDGDLESTRRDGAVLPDAAMARDSGGSAFDSGPASTIDSGMTPRIDSGIDGGIPEGCASGPLAGPIPGCRPPVPATTGDPGQDCVNRINQLRWECQCLPPLARWNDGETCATMHAEYDSTRSPHAGFSGRICSPGGSGQNECPGWGSVSQTIDGCLQQMWDEGPGEPFSAHGHYINMTNPGHSRVACGFHDGAGGVWAVQNFQ